MSLASHETCSQIQSQRYIPGIFLYLCTTLAYVTLYLKAGFFAYYAYLKVNLFVE
jgi:hypothetical protein